MGKVTIERTTVERACAEVGDGFASITLIRAELVRLVAKAEPMAERDACAAQILAEARADLAALDAHDRGWAVAS